LNQYHCLPNKEAIAPTNENVRIKPSEVVA
jgi:hypothetical protein